MGCVLSLFRVCHLVFVYQMSPITCRHGDRALLSRSAPAHPYVPMHSTLAIQLTFSPLGALNAADGNRRHGFCSGAFSHRGQHHCPEMRPAVAGAMLCAADVRSASATHQEASSAGRPKHPREYARKSCALMEWICNHARLYA